MEIENILRIIWLILMVVAFTLMIIYWVRDLKKSDAYWNKLNAELQLMKTTLKKERDLLKGVQAYAEWLDTYHSLMHTNVKLEDSEFNKGILTAAEDVQENFLKFLGEYVDGKESSN
jgi:sensor domain CHASE-containing protein